MCRVKEIRQGRKEIAGINEFKYEECYKPYLRSRALLYAARMHAGRESKNTYAGRKCFSVKARVPRNVVARGTTPFTCNCNLLTVCVLWYSGNQATEE